MQRKAPYDRDTALDAALRLFWDKGYHAASLKDLEAALGMKPGSIYAAFSSKENLYLLALERYFTASRARFRDRMAAAPTPLAGLAGFIRSFTGLLPADPGHQACMLTRTLVDTRTTEPAISARACAYIDGMRQEFARAFDAAKAAGELPAHADSDHLSRRYQANISALRLELHQGTEAEKITALAEDMVREMTAPPSRADAASAPPSVGSAPA